MRGALLAILGLFGWWTKPDPAPGGDVRFEGNQSFAAAQLRAILRNRYYVPLEGDFGVTEADDAAYFLRAFYFSRGYREARVAYTYRPTQPPSALFDIDEGGQDSIAGVTFEGASEIPPRRLLEIFTATVRQSTLRPFGRMRYVAGAVEAGRLSIVNALAFQGFLTATADVSEPAPAVGGLIDLRVRIYQGVRFFVRQVTFTGSPVDDATMKGVLNEYLNQPYQRNQESLMRTRILDWLRNHGYLQADVATVPALNPDTGDVDVSFIIAPGRTFTIGKIIVDARGSANAVPSTDTSAPAPTAPAPAAAHPLITREAAIRARFGIAPGALYDASKVDAAARRLWFSGAFAEADVRRAARSDGTVDLHLQLAEAPAKRIQFGLGYSQWDRVFGEAHYIDRNFFGTLNRFSVDGFLSQKSYGLSTSFTDPWVFKSDFESSVGLSYARRELPAYKSTELGGTLSFTRRANDVTLTGYRVQYGYKRVTDAVIFGDDTANPDPNYTLGSISYSQTFDTRNNILSPMKGLYLNYEAELANPVLLGDIAFLRLSAQATYYLPLREITTEHPFVPFLVFNHRLGLMFPYGSTASIPVQERFFLGGPDTVRSFQLDGLGPQDGDGDPLGGLAMLLFNAEIQWPVLNNIYLAAFADAGNLWSSVRDVQPTDLQLGIGPGLRVYTPLGAVRIDYGYNVNRHPGDPVGAWQVGFGFTF